MNILCFRMKRAFQSSLRITGPVLKLQGLTPARFDMLMAIGLRSSTLQSELRFALGVTNQTISRMLRSLEAVGFITRARCERDKRYLLVTLTIEGIRRVQRAVAAASIQPVHQAFDRALARARERLQGDSQELGMQLGTKLAVVLAAIAGVFGDWNSLRYEWPPDDSPFWPDPPSVVAA